MTTERATTAPARASHDTTTIHVQRNWLRVVSTLWGMSVMLLIGSCGPLIRVFAPSTLEPPELPLPPAIQGIVLCLIIAFLLIGIRWAVRVVAHLFVTITDDGMQFPMWSAACPILWLDIQAYTQSPNALKVTTAQGPHTMTLIAFTRPDDIVTIVASYLSIPEDVRWLL